MLKSLGAFGVRCNLNYVAEPKSRQRPMAFTDRAGGADGGSFRHSFCRGQLLTRTACFVAPLTWLLRQPLGTQ
jgi:hypothetical protein